MHHFELRVEIPEDRNAPNSLNDFLGLSALGPAFFLLDRPSSPALFGAVLGDEGSSEGFEIGQRESRATRVDYGALFLDSFSATGPAAAQNVASQVILGSSPVTETPRLPPANPSILGIWALPELNELVGIDSGGSFGGT